MKIDYIVEILLIIGGLNLGIFAAFNFDVLESFFGYPSPLLFIVYGLIGIAAIVRIARMLNLRVTK